MFRRSWANQIYPGRVFLESVCYDVYPAKYRKKLVLWLLRFEVKLMESKSKSNVDMSFFLWKAESHAPSFTSLQLKQKYEFYSKCQNFLSWKWTKVFLIWLLKVFSLMVLMGLFRPWGLLVWPLNIAWGLAKWYSKVHKYHLYLTPLIFYTKSVIYVSFLVIFGI